MTHHHRSFKGKDHQVVWADLEAWIEQLYEEFGGQVDVRIQLPPAGFGVRPSVSVRVVKRGVGREETELWSDYRVFQWQDKGGTERLALQLVSAALLELSSDKERSERQLTLL